MHHENREGEIRARFQPSQSSLRAVLVYGVAVAALGGLAFADDGSLWPPRGHLAILFWSFVAASPLLSLQLGWSFELTDDALFVYRFGRHRSTHALRGFIRRDATLRLPRLEFRDGVVRMFAGSDAPARAFLAELDRAVAKARFGDSRPEVELLGVDRLRLPLAYLTVPGPCCVACESPATHEMRVRADRSTNYVAFEVADDGAFHVPVCARHRWAARLAVPLAFVALFGVGTIVSTIGIRLWSGRPFADVHLMLGFVGGAVAVHFGSLLRFGRAVGHAIFGVTVVDVSSDLSIVTIRVRDSSLRERIARAVVDPHENEARGVRTVVR